MGEMFTGEPIVDSRTGRVSPGMAMVARPGQGCDDIHLFLYDFDAITKWQEEHATDPTTRENLSADDIVRLTAPLPRWRQFLVRLRTLRRSSCRDCWSGVLTLLGRYA